MEKKKKEKAQILTPNMELIENIILNNAAYDSYNLASVTIEHSIKIAENYKDTEDIHNAILLRCYPKLCDEILDLIYKLYDKLYSFPFSSANEVYYANGAAKRVVLHVFSSVSDLLVDDMASYSATREVPQERIDKTKNYIQKKCEAEIDICAEKLRDIYRLKTREKFRIYFPLILGIGGSLLSAIIGGVIGTLGGEYLRTVLSYIMGQAQ